MYFKFLWGGLILFTFKKPLRRLDTSLRCDHFLQGV